MKTKKNLILPSLAVLCVLSLAVMVLALTRQEKIPTETGEFTPPPFDRSAVVGSPAVPDGLGWQELDAQAYLVGICGKFILKGSTADVWLTNPISNTVWLKVRVLDEKGNVFGETGLIKPGEYVQSVTLAALPKTGKTLVLKVMAYQPDTYHSEGAVTLRTTAQTENAA